MESQPKFKLGIALSGGGARGFAHLGVLQAMNERGFYPDVIAGTSAGSLAGVLYADGYEPHDIFEIFRKTRFTEIIATTLSQEGFFKTTGLRAMLKKHLNAERFEDLKIPLYVVASDLEAGEAHIFSKGDLVPAVTASCSVPIVFTPMEIEERHYIDGGVFLNFPVSVIRQKCKVVVGVDVSPVTPMKYDKSYKYIIEQTMNYMVGANTVDEAKLCDHLITSGKIARYSLFDLKFAEEIYAKGYTMAVDYLDKHGQQLARDLADAPPPQPFHHKVKKLFRPFRKKK